MMSTDDFDLRLKHIEEQHGARREAADAYRDQEMAKLFNECDWTQEQIARRMGKTRQWVSLQLCFGAFLKYATSGCETRPEAISALTERGFRALWKKTPKKLPDRERFAQVLEMLAVRETPEYKRLVHKPGYVQALREILADGRWRTNEAILADMEERFPDYGRDRLPNHLNLLGRSAPGHRMESARRGGVWQHRMVALPRERPTAADVASLYEQVKPFIEEIKFWGTRHRAEVSPQEIHKIGVRLERLFDAILSGEYAGNR